MGLSPKPSLRETVGGAGHIPELCEPDTPVNIGAILIWKSSNLLLLIPVVIGLVMLVRWFQGRALFTERDWLLLLGHPREKVFTLRLWLRFIIFLLLAMVTIPPSFGREDAL
jgi:hypothetical protein